MDNIQRVDVKSLETVWRLLFEGLEFEDDERVEIAYKEFKRAIHVKTLNDFIETAKQLSGNSDVTIAPCTKKIQKEKENKRTGKEEAYRQKCIILDIDNPNKHERFTEEEALELANKAIEKIKSEIGDFGLSAIGYTGGGVQLYISLGRVLKGEEEIENFCNLLKECLGDIKLGDNKLIDNSSFTPSQLQRLLGTYNLKYSPPALSKFLVVFEDKKYSSTETFEGIASQKEKEKKEGEQKGYLDAPSNTNTNTIFKNLKKVKREIRAKIRASDLDTLGIVLDIKRKSKDGKYSSASCPFHPPDTNPSFGIFHKNNMDFFIDFHTWEYYDVIKLYMKLKNKSEEEAIKDLANIAGVKLDKEEEENGFSGENKKEFEKTERLSSFNAYEYVKNELKIQKVNYWSDEEGYYLEITAENNEGGSVSFTIPAKTLRNHNSALRVFFQYTYRNPKKLPKGAEEEFWDQVIEVIKEMGEKVNMGDTVAEKLDAIKEAINSGRITSDLNDYLSTSSSLIFAKDGKAYIQLAKLLNRLKTKYAFVFDDLKMKDLQQLLRKLGAEPVRYSGKRIRLWLLPKDDEEEKGRQDTTRTAENDSGVLAQNIDNQEFAENKDGRTALLKNNKNDDDDVKKEEVKNKNENKNVVSFRPSDDINIDREGGSGRTADDDSGVLGVLENDVNFDNQEEERRTAENNETDDDALFYPENF